MPRYLNIRVIGRIVSYEMINKEDPNARKNLQNMNTLQLFFIYFPFSSSSFLPLSYSYSHSSPFSSLISYFYLFLVRILKHIWTNSRKLCDITNHFHTRHRGLAPHWDLLVPKSWFYGRFSRDSARWNRKLLHKLATKMPTKATDFLCKNKNKKQEEKNKTKNSPGAAAYPSLWTRPDWLSTWGSASASWRIPWRTSCAE